MLQEATQPTAEQKKAGGQEQGLKDCCDRTSEWKFGQPQKDPGNTVYKYIYIHMFNLPRAISSIYAVACTADSRIRAKPATSKAKPPV